MTGMSDDGGPGCPFCDRISRGEYDEELSLPDQVAVFEPLGPVTPGHLLVLPFRHVRDAAEEPHVTGYVMEHAARLLNHFSSPAIGPYEANLITSVGRAATQSVFHLHVHLIPHREGDGLVLPWTDQQARDWLTTEVARYLCSVREHGPESVAMTGWELADRLTSNREDRKLLTSILTGNKPDAAP